MVPRGDYHTHTTLSHGKGSILDNAKIAAKKGLSELAITDHGFDHMLYAVDRKAVKGALEEIKEASRQTGVKIYFGVEANFLSSSGEVDVRESDFEFLDILVVGFHRFVRTSLKERLKFFLPNILGVKSKKRIAKNTDAVIKAVRKYPIDILSHLGYGFKIDARKLAPVLKETDTKVEINSRKNCLTDEELLIFKEAGCKFVIDSDAHTSEDVGKLDKALSLVIKLGLEDVTENINGTLKPKPKR